jgi:transmembrane sensor
MDEIIDREQRGEATQAELQQLSEWRRSSVANEHEYRRTIQMLAAVRSLASAPRAAPPSAAAVLARHRVSELIPSPRTRWSIVVITAVTTAVAGFVVAWMLDRGRAPDEWGFGDVVTAGSEMATVELRDGSVVRLAPSSRVRVVASDSARDVTLEGRAFFAVANNVARPFIVHTTAGDTRVVGTRFELATHDRDLDLIVVGGRASLSAGGVTVTVRSGEQSGVRNEQALVPMPVANAGHLEEWVGKFFIFQSTPLRDAARKIEQMYNVHVIVADSATAARTVTATFTDQRLAQVLDVVCRLAGTGYVSRGDTVIVSRR